SVYALNQTYTIYANQSGYSTTHELYFSVDTVNAHTVVENQAIDAIGFHPPFNNGTTCWTVSPALPGNLSMDTSTGEITGSVNGTLTNTTYTVTANHGCSGSGSGSGTTTYGNGSTWNVADLKGSQGSSPGAYFFMAVGDTLYFDADNGTEGRELWAHDTSNDSTWLVADINPDVGGLVSSNPGRIMVVLVGDTLYFDADGSDGKELWAHDTSNHSTWQVADISIGSGSSDDSTPGLRMHTVVGDTLYFDAYNT
ncbi:MAG: hypothetical protein QF699_07585, partial [Candidatus Poseidoniaceae archaeon]|nr:hypothetical protein [Candidatus Poseidoniaceae archaeon]